MNSFIVCLECPEAPPMFEIAICADAEEARIWAEELLAFAPGFEVSRIMSPSRPAHPES